MLKNKYIIWLQTIFIIFVCLFLNSQTVLAETCPANLVTNSISEYVFSANGDEILFGKAKVEVTNVTGNGADDEYKGITKNATEKMSDLQVTITNNFCDRTQKYIENDYKMPDGQGDYVITDYFLYKTYIADSQQVQKGPVSNMYKDIETFLNQDSSEYDEFIIKVDLGGKTYKFSTFTSKYGIPVTKIDSEGEKYPDTEYVSKNAIESFVNNPPSDVYSVDMTFSEEQYDLFNEEYIIYSDTMEALKKIDTTIRLGVLAGSIGAGYNVGTVYSTTQISLYDAMKLQENETYDFKNAGALKYSFSYYMNPLAGKLDFIDSPIPTDVPTWVSYLEGHEVREFISDYNILIAEEFVAFESGLSEDQINEQGMKKTKKANFKNGVKALTDVGKSKTPGSVLSYNMKIAYPYIFYKVGGNYKLLTSSLKVDNEYLYCIYNDRVYNNKFEEITNRLELGIDRTQLFLYYQIDPSGNYVGVVLVGAFDEGVIDTSTNDNGTLYATGRKIGFNNGYSDLLTFNRANPQLMFSTSEGGKRGYLPKNVAFLPTDEETKAIETNMTIVPEAVSQGKAKYEVITIPSNDVILSELSQMEKHDLINSEPDAFKIHILFTQIINKKGKEELEEKTEDEGSSTNTSTNNNIDEQIEELGLSHYAFIIIRNNRYINDSELISWLQTDTARSITYVDADTLLKKITGDFIDELEKLTYEDWLKMQEIKSELQYNKDTWLIRVLNVVSIVMGVFLIIFAILICLAYWIDIFNTLTDFSILQFISFGNLYPVENKDLLPYISEEKSATKYVTFKDVLVIAGICCGLAVLFMNVTTLISWIVQLYNYIMFVLGGK